MDPITLALGTSVAKWTFRLWLKDTPFESLSSDLTDLVRGRFADLLAARQAGREFDRLAELMAERLSPYVFGEFRDLDSGERTAAAGAANDALESALSANLDPIKFDLDAEAVERAIRANVPDAATKAFLSEGGTALYDLLLSEACGYIVAATAKLPDFSSQAAKELLTRTSRLADMTAEAIDRLPRTVPESWGTGSEDEIFTNKYLKSVVQRNDKLQIFGVSDANYRAAYSLSVAYLSLTATTPVPGTLKEFGKSQVSADAGLNPDEGNRPADAESDVVRVEATLSANSRLLLGGSAGSGKTTLLQWISVTASQSAFGDEMASWNGYIPFLLPLRRFASTEMPAPEKFVEVSHRNLAGAMPSGWVHKVMADGRALVLIDGLDELPDDRRPMARKWLTELMIDFPECKYVVTSRPLAISTDWEDLPDFQYSELLPMNRGDIRAFVSHWHRAAAAVIDTAEDRHAIDEAERHLLSSLFALPHIAMLSTSPLLCALICAMHRQNANKLPENRMELYETALQMLVSSRDHERDVNLSAYPDLVYAEQRALLADFALWLHESGASDTEEAHLYRRIGKKLPQLPRRTEADSGEVGRFLLARSGVLRVPVEGRVDFVHRTFLEYLAAAELVSDEAIDKIVTHAHLDQWREVVVMAAGHFTPKSRESLLARLVHRGREEPENQHRLFLLAVACLETSPVLSPEVQKLLDDCLEEIMPPGNMGDALAIASAGDLAVPRLTGKRLRATESAAAIRALSLIGTDDAFEAIKYYAPDTRVTVARELIRAWGQFDAERYADEVLAHSPLDEGHIVVTEPNNIEHISKFHHLKTAFLDVPGKVLSLNTLEPSSEVIGFNLSRATGIRDLGGIDRFPNLRTAWIANSASLVSLRGLADCREIRSVFVHGCPNLEDIGDLAAFGALAQVHLENTAAASLSPITHIAIDDLRVGGGAFESLGINPHVSSLSMVYSPRLRDIQALAEWQGLNSAHLMVSGVDMPSSITLPPLLTSLVMGGRTFNEFGLRGGETLRRLEAMFPLHIENPLPELMELHLSVEGLRDLRAVGALSSSAFPKLIEVWVYGRDAASVTIPGFVKDRVRRGAMSVHVHEERMGFLFERARQ